MATRKIIDIEQNGEKVWPKGHAKATFMSDGRTVEEAVNAASNSGNNIDLSGYATKEELSNKVDKVDGKQLSTEDFTTLLKQKLEGLSNYDDTAIQASVTKLRTDLDTLVSGDTTTAIKTFNEVIAFLDGLEDAEDLESIIASIEQQIAAKYTKPSTGIPKNDLASDVQTSLEKADTALQEHQDISGKQDVLVSGTNIKSINGESILGSGNIVLPTNITETDPVFTASPAHAITADDISAWNDKMDETPILNHGTDDTTCSIAPNIFHLWGEVASLNITLATPDDPTILNEYMFQFTSGATAAVLSLPSDIVWISEPTIEASKTYQISIVNNLAVIGGF